MGASDPLPAGYVIWFRSLEFRATGNGYLMELLTPRSNPDVPAPQPRRRRSSGQRARRARMERGRVVRPSLPAWVEARAPQTDATMGSATPSSPKPTATLTGDSASRPPLYPHGMRSSAMTYASSVSTDMSAYEDLPGHHLLSIRNLIASTPDSSYLDSADEGSIPAQDRMNPEWDYSGIRDLGAFLSFQAAADYCLTCSDDSSEGNYDPTRECFVDVLGEHNSDIDDDDAADAAQSAIAAVGATAAAGPSAPANAAEQQAQLAQLRELEAKLDEEHRQMQKLRLAL